MKLKKIKKQIEKIKKMLLCVGEMRPGSLSKQYSVCGKKNCRCVDPKKPKKHGPYYQLSYVCGGKNTSRFIRPKFYKQTKQEIEQYKKFRALIDQWIKLALEHSQEKIDQEKKTEVELKTKKLKL